MKIEYKFVTGEKVNIEVYGKFEEIMLELKHELQNHDRKETRRHESIYEFNDKFEVWKCRNGEITEKQIFKTDKDKLYAAISKLKPSEQELLHKLYLSKSPISQARCAEELGVPASTLRKRVERTRKKLEELLR